MKISKVILPGLLVPVLFLGLITPSSAQIKIDTSKVYKLGEVIISASKYEQSPRSVGRNVTVITSEEIRQSIYTSVADLLADQQSIHLIGNGQTPGSLQQGFIRGSNSNHAVVMIDGIRISDPSTVNNSIDLSELSVTGIKRIEIVRGSHSTLYGSSAIGGVINIITKKRGTPGLNANLSTRHGRFGEGTYSTANSLFANYTIGNGFYANLGIYQQFTNGLDATIDTVSNPNIYNPQDDDNFNKLDLVGKIGFKTERHDLYVSYRKIHQKIEADAGAYRDDDNLFTDFNRDLFSYGAGTELSPNLSLQLSGAYSDLQRDIVNDSSVVSPDRQYDGSYNETNAKGSLWKNELRATFKGDGLRLVAGALASRQTMSTRNYVYSRSQFGVYESTVDLDSLNLREIIYSGYLHSSFSGGLISESLNRFSLVLGGRYVRHNAFGSHFTYEINPKYQLGESSLIYGAITSGFNAPSLYQLHSPARGFGAYTSRGNAHLDPEVSISYELGWKQQISEALSFELALFQTKVSNVIEYVYLWNSSTPIADLSGADYLGDTYINLSQQNIRGIEVSVSANAGPKLSLNGTASFIKSELSFSPADVNENYTGGHHVQLFESGKFVTGKQVIEGLSRRPFVNASVSAAYRVTDVLSFEVDSRFVGSRDDVFYASNLGPFGALDRTEVSAYNITDLSARYRVTGHFSVIGKIENIFDTDYVEINGYKTRGRGFFVKLRYEL
ncbi:MAG TPA: TonB-dependent receptor [Balneolaceae bacterium]|nr:TonB-dependent receptor [Balneolaceae bacterium]